VQPFYFKGEGVGQHWFNLSDPGVEEALYDRKSSTRSRVERIFGTVKGFLGFRKVRFGNS